MKFAPLAFRNCFKILNSVSKLTDKLIHKFSGMMIRSVAVFVCAVALTACDGQRETREILNMPDMHFSPSYKAQEENPYADNGAMMLPPEGTIPVNFVPYTITDAEADEKASQIPNPLPKTEAVLKTGQKYYEIHCIVCHGPAGDGLGSVIKANVGMPMPPKLYSEKIRTEWTDGRIFHVITNGQGNMPAYNARIKTENRWAIIHYLRAMGEAWEESQGTGNQADAAPVELKTEDLANFADPELNENLNREVAQGESDSDASGTE